MISYWHHPVVRLSVCDAVHCGAQGLCTRLKVAPACAFRNGSVRSDFSDPDAHGPEIVTTGLIVLIVVYERPARSVPGFALITAPVLTFLFTGRDAAITVHSVKIDITQ